MQPEGATVPPATANHSYRNASTGLTNAAASAGTDEVTSPASTVATAPTAAQNTDADMGTPTWPTASRALLVPQQVRYSELYDAPGAWGRFRLFGAS